MSLVEQYLRIERCHEVDKEKWTSKYTRIMWKKVNNTYIGSKFWGKYPSKKLAWNTLYSRTIEAKSFAR